MKTKRIASMMGSMLTFFMAALVLLATTGCEKENPIPSEEFKSPEALYTGNVLTQNFWIHPDGGTVNLFDGMVELIIPDGAVRTSSQFTMASFPIGHLDLDGFNLYNRGFSLQGISSDQVFPNGITIKIKYDVLEANWLKDLPVNEENLKIYWVSPTLYSYERVVPLKNCCVDCDCKIIKGCIGTCGFYVVGEN